MATARNRFSSITRSIFVGLLVCLVNAAAGSSSLGPATAHAQVGSDGVRAWVDADMKASLVEYAPQNQFNAFGNYNTVAKIQIGRYRVRLIGYGRSRGNVQITHDTRERLYGTYQYNNGHCVVDDTYADYWGDLYVYVSCYSIGGDRNYRDSNFQLYYTAWSEILDVCVGTAPCTGGIRRVGPRGGYLWMTDPTNASFWPNQTDDQMHWNPNGLVNWSERLGTGRYLVHFPSLAIDRAVAYVTALGGRMVSTGVNRFCKVASMGRNGTEGLVWVNCFAVNGTAADSRFSILYEQSTLNGGFLAAPLLTSTSSYAAPAQQFNAIGDVNSVARNSTGFYLVTIPALPGKNNRSNGYDSVRGTVIVTATGSKPTRCSTTGWSEPYICPDCGNAPGSTQLYARIGVYCFNSSTGTLADSAFNVRYGQDR